MEPLAETAQAIEEYGPFLQDGDLLEVLQDLADQVVALVPDCVGLSLASYAEGVTFTMVATTAEIAALDAVQYLDTGPCVTSAEEGRVVESRAGDPLDEERWGSFVRASAVLGIGSTLTLPVSVADRLTGTVNLYARSARAFDGRHEQIARVFSAWAPGATTNADLAFTTREAAQRAPAELKDSLQVQIAAGLLAAEGHVTPEQARERIRDAALRSGLTEGQLAAALVKLFSADAG
ncbi:MULTISPECIES: GAF domain-containing protein [unclassified Nocardioides]|uniref:GAF domain-containing protein n=1 Tax=unclassified Nocardioides TaxID=2615069 RepID=UPI000AA4487C|nr:MULTISPECIES: GAF domain-containing protein [unclassified Nocardioides]